MRGEPADDLGRGALLRAVVGGGDLRVEGGGQGPGLRAVDDDLDEPQPAGVGPQPALRLPGVHVVPGHPRLVRRTVHHPRHHYRGGDAGGRPRERPHRRPPRGWRRTGWPARCPRPGSSHRRGTGRPRRRSGPRPRTPGRTSPHHAPGPTARHCSSTTLETTFGPPWRADRSIDLRSMRAARSGAFKASVDRWVSGLVTARHRASRRTARTSGGRLGGEVLKG